VRTGPSRSQRKRPPITQTCTGCGNTELPPKPYPYCHEITKRYLCEYCKSQTPPTTEFSTVIKAPTKFKAPTGFNLMLQQTLEPFSVKPDARMQRRLNLACISCKELPVIVNDLVDGAFPDIVACLVMLYLTEGSPNKLVTTDEDICSLSCGRRLCLECCLDIIHAGELSGFQACVCKESFHLISVFALNN
jgi:hypothetical protein